MIKFKENTFVKGTYDELMEMAKAIEEKGAKVKYDGGRKSNILWYDNVIRNVWRFSYNLGEFCYHELTKSQLYEAYGIVDTKTETDKFLEKDEHGFYKSRLIENMEKQPKFKKGDTVRCIDGNVLHSSAGWEKGKEFIVDEIALHDRPLYFPKNGAGVWEEHLELVAVETRPIQISQETATRWYNGEDNELKQLAIQTFPELDEATPKVGDLCMFADKEEDFLKGFGAIGILNGYDETERPSVK